MNSENIIIEGRLYDGYTPIGFPVQLSIYDGEATLTGSGIARTYHGFLLRVTPRSGRPDRFVILPDGCQVQCADNPMLDLLKNDSPAEGPVAWLEDRIGVALGSVLVIVALLICGYFYGLPAAADWAVTRVSIATEQSLGKDALNWLDSNQWFQRTNVDNPDQIRISHIFSNLVTGSRMERYYHLEFRSSEMMGANALTLPGGIIVITDGMVSIVKTDDEIAAVLAHEIGHAELRHTLKQVMQGSVLAIIAGAVTNDASSYTVAVAGLPALLAQNKYSRSFETEADDFAFKLLKQHHISPTAFASLMERVIKEQGDEGSSFSFLSTHPITSERVKRARRADMK